MYVGNHNVFKSDEDGGVRTLFEIVVYVTFDKNGKPEGDIFEALYKKFSFLKEFEIYSHQEVMDTNARIIENYMIFDITDYEKVMKTKPHLFI